MWVFRLMTRRRSTYLWSNIFLSKTQSMIIAHWCCCVVTIRIRSSQHLNLIAVIDFSIASVRFNDTRCGTKSNQLFILCSNKINERRKFVNHCTRLKCKIRQRPVSFRMELSFQLTTDKNTINCEMNIRGEFVISPLNIFAGCDDCPRPRCRSALNNATEGKRD